MVPLTQRLPLAAIAAPALAGVLLAIVVVVQALGGAAPWAAPADLTLSEAAALRDHLEIRRQVQRGVDPNVPARVRRDYIKSTEYTLTPLEAAVGIRRLDVVQLLISFGAVVHEGNLPVLVCFAKQERADDIAAWLTERFAAETPISCDRVRVPW